MTFKCVLKNCCYNRKSGNDVNLFFFPRIKNCSIFGLARADTLLAPKNKLKIVDALNLKIVVIFPFGLSMAFWNKIVHLFQRNETMIYRVACMQGSTLLIHHTLD